MCGRAGEELRPHPRDESQEAGHPAAHVQGPARLRPLRAAGPRQRDRSRKARPRQARDRHDPEARRAYRDDRGAPQPHRRAHHVVQGRVGAECGPGRADVMAGRVKIPRGDKVTIDHGKLRVPDNPVIAFIEGDGTGPDIWRAAVRVLDAAVEQAYRGRKKIAWAEVFAGEKAQAVYGRDCPPNLLPDETLDVIREILVAIKGPLTTPVGEGFRSLKVTLRQVLDLYVCLRPVKYFQGVPSPAKRPDWVDMVIFRENTEDIYAGIEWEQGTPECRKVVDFLQQEMKVAKIRFPHTSSIGIKPVSKEGSERLIRAAIRYAIENGRRNVTLVHKGNIQKYTEGMFMKWGYALAKREFSDKLIGWDDCGGKPPAGKTLVKDAITDAFLQQLLTRHDEFDVIPCCNLTGDLISDALAAQVGGIGIAPGANINAESGHALFEATHGTAPKYTGQDKVNPGPVILSGEMMLRHMGWTEAADRIMAGLEKTLAQKIVTYDFARLMEGAKEVKCSEFGTAIIKNMETL